MLSGLATVGKWQGSRVRYYALVLQEDRNVIIYGPGIWSTGTQKTSVGGVVHTVVNGTVGEALIESQNVSTMTVGEISRQNATAAIKVRNVLLSGEMLVAGQSLDVGSYSFKMQDTCNLVLYDRSVVIWTSNAGFPNRRCYATMQTDGNFVLYSPNAVIWASHSWQGNRVRQFVLVLQEDRNIVIYGPTIWSTGTSIRSVGGVVHTLLNGTVGGGFLESQSVGEISPHNATALGKVVAPAPSI